VRWYALDARTTVRILVKAQKVTNLFA